MRNITSLTAAAVLAAATVASAAGVDSNLGTIGLGVTNLTGTTVGADNDIDTYLPIANQTLVWAGDYIYQFTTTVATPINLTSNDPNTGVNDNDFFLVDSLAVTTNANGLRTASGAYGAAPIEVSGSFGVVPAGTHYLIVDAFQGAPTTATPPGSAFNAQLRLGAPPAPASIAATIGGSTSLSLAAGQVQFYGFTVTTASSLTFDTEGSTLSGTNDTELGLYDSNGVLVGSDDDGGTGNLSLLTASVTPGTYYLAAGAFNTTFGAGFAATSVSTATGNLIINGLSVGVPEPISLALLSLGGLALVCRRRA